MIRGNTAVLKCSIPSFVADFVYVESWIDEDGIVYKASDNYGAIFRLSIDFHCGFFSFQFLVRSTEKRNNDKFVDPYTPLCSSILLFILRFMSRTEANQNEMTD